MPSDSPIERRDQALIAFTLVTGARDSATASMRIKHIDVHEWVTYLRDELGFGPDDPLFPSTKIGQDTEGSFAPIGLTQECWATAAPIRAIFKEAFKRAGLPNFNPHSFRKTLVLLALDRDLNEATMKSWSQNLGHENMRTTLMSYGEIPAHQQRELIRAAGRCKDDDRIALELGRELLAKVRAKKAA